MIKERRQYYIDKEFNKETNRMGYTIISRHESGLEFQLTKVFDTLEEANTELQRCIELRKNMFDIEVVDLMIM